MADALETKPVYLLWFVFTCLETPGPWSSWCHALSGRFTAESKKGLFFCHSVETYPGEEGEEHTKNAKTQELSIVTFDVEGSGLRVPPASVWGGWWVMDFEQGVWGGKKLARNQKAVLVTQTKPEGISFLSLETGNQLWFSAAFLQESVWGRPQLHQGGAAARPVGLQRDRCYIHRSSVMRGHQ